MLRRELEAPSTERRGGGGSRSVITTWSGSARVLPPASRRGSCTHRFAVVLSGPCLLVYLCLSFCSSSCLSKQAPFCLLNLVWSVSFVSSLFLSACLPVPNSTHGFALISSGPCLPVSLSLSFFLVLFLSLAYQLLMFFIMLAKLRFSHCHVYTFFFCMCTYCRSTHVS